MIRVVVDTNLWIRALLGGPMSTPLLEAWRDRQFEVAVSNPLVDELIQVRRRPRLRARISETDALELEDQLRSRGITVELSTVPPRCRDPKDHPVLATAIDGRAQAIVTGDDDLRADKELRQAMLGYGVELWGLQRLFEAIRSAAP